MRKTMKPGFSTPGILILMFVVAYTGGPASTTRENTSTDREPKHTRPVPRTSFES